MRLKEDALRKYSATVQFLNTDIWRLQTHKLPPRRSFWITQLRILLLAVRRFNVDRCELRASALTFYSLLSIVPIVAMAFAVAKGFGVEKILGEQLMDLRCQADFFDYLLRQCVNRQRPFGKIESQDEMARLFGLEARLRPGGRPRAKSKK